MRILFPLCVVAFLAAPAKADKFWFSAPDKQSVEGSLPDMIEGVLLDEDAVNFHVRVVGGEVVIAKKRVVKREADELTVEAIAAAEKRMHDEAAVASARRAETRTQRDVKVAEASASRSGARATPAPAPAAVRAPAAAPEFDPVLGIASPAATLSKAELQRELQAAWTLTKDRRYLEALRKVRRLR